MAGKNHLKFSKYLVFTALILGLFIWTHQSIPTAKAAECNNEYSADLQVAINEVLAQNPDVGAANNCSTESVTTLLNGTVTLLRDRGFLAGRVWRAGVNGLSDDKILIAKPGDTAGEMYDVISGAGLSTKKIGDSIVFQCADTAPISEFEEPGDTPIIECTSDTLPPPILDPNAIPRNPDLPVPSQGLPTDLGQLISAIFSWSLSIIGLVIFVRFFYAGFLWFTFAGNATNVGKAKDIMQNAVLGALVLFSAWLILNTINPDLVGGVLDLPGLPGNQP